MEQRLLLRLRRRRAAFVVRLPPAGTATPGIDAPSLADPSGLHIRRHDFAGHFVVSRDDVRDVRGGGDAEVSGDWQSFQSWV